MRSSSVRLYSFALPFIPFILPIMDAGISEIGSYLRGPEFRQLFGEFVIQVAIGIFDAFIMFIASLLFGTLGT